MKTVLIVTTEPPHEMIYGLVLGKYFKLEYSPRAKGGSGHLTAVVYDIPGLHGEVDIDWLKRALVPVVVLTAETSLPVFETPTRRILPYPVSGREVLGALWDMGVRPEGTASGVIGKFRDQPGRGRAAP